MPLHVHVHVHVYGAGELLFPIEGGSLDRHHSFIVQYEVGKDLGLDMHTDNSDVTFNVCLGRGAFASVRVRAHGFP